MFPSRGHDLPSVEEQALRDHLAGCSLCLSAAKETEEWDANLHAAMTNVPIPDGLHERLLAQLARSTAPTTATQTPPQAHRRSFQQVASWLALSLLLFAGTAYWLVRAPRLPLASVENGAIQQLRNHRDSELVAFDQSFAAEVSDSKWQKVCQSKPIGVNLDQRAGHDLAAFRVNIPTLRFRGWLVLVPISRIVDIPSSTYLDATHYAQTAAWHDDRFVYICLAEQGSLETLIAQWNSSAA
ncbi:MAG: hypothetical protein U0929_07370 [Planctomycetaceae bacterium]